jgi:hypothetical protein
MTVMAFKASVVIPIEEQEVPQDFDEDEVVAFPPRVARNIEPRQEEQVHEPEEVDKDGAKLVDIPKVDQDKMNVASLKAELARQVVNAKGWKAELKARLIDALERLVKALPEGMVKAHGNILGGFAETAYCSQLKPRNVPISTPMVIMPYIKTDLCTCSISKPPCPQQKH